jgi:hypothetical protein
MLVFLQRFQDLVVKLVLYVAAVGSMAIDRLWPGRDAIELVSTDAPPSPQEMLVRLTTVMIAGSLTMLALGYSARAQTGTARG